MRKFPQLVCVEKLFQGLELTGVGVGWGEKVLKSHLNSILYLLLRICT